MAHTSARVRITVLEVVHKIVQTIVTVNTSGRDIERTFLWYQFYLLGGVFLQHHYKVNCCDHSYYAS